MNSRTAQWRFSLKRLKGLLHMGAILAAVCSSALVQAQVNPVPADPPPQYDSQGKRDPFLSLEKTQANPEDSDLQLQTPPLNRRPPGLPGLLIDEVTVVGVVTAGGSPMALLQGVDKFTYFASPRDQLFDGHVESIDGEEVAFVRNVRDTRGKVHTSRVFKKLYTQEVVVEEQNKEQAEEGGGQ